MWRSMSTGGGQVKGQLTVPSHLRDCHYSGAEKLGHGDGYKYAHDYPNHYVKQQYLPDGLEGSTFYRPSENGYEKKIGEWLHFLKALNEKKLLFRWILPMLRIPNRQNLLPELYRTEFSVQKILPVNSYYVPELICMKKMFT